MGWGVLPVTFLSRSSCAPPALTPGGPLDPVSLSPVADHGGREVAGAAAGGGAQSLRAGRSRSCSSACSTRPAAPPTTPRPRDPAAAGALLSAGKERQAGAAC